MVTITFEVDSELLAEATKILEKCGLTVEEACVLFIKETVKRGRIPFDYTDEDIKAAKKMCEKKDEQ